MKNRKPVVILMIILVVVCALIATIIILVQSAISESQNQIPISAPVSSTTGNILTPPPNQNIDYAYALINTSDNIKLKTTLGDELLISIDQKNWKDIQWSTNGSHVSALGETSAGVFNLFVYDISTQTWIQASLFDTDGITSYKWVDDDTVLFTQDGWLHRYKYSTLNEIVKILQVDGTIVDESPDQTTVLLKTSTGVFEVVGLDGKVLFTLDKITDSSSDALQITQVLYSKDSKTLFFVTQGNAFYTWLLGAPSATQVQVQNDGSLDPSKLNILCSQEVGVFKTYTLENNAVNFFDLDTTAQTLDSLTNKGLTTGSTASGFECSGDDQVDFKIETTEQTSWYQMVNGKIEIIVPLSDATEVAFKN